MRADDQISGDDLAMAEVLVRDRSAELATKPGARRRGGAGALRARRLRGAMRIDAERAARAIGKLEHGRATVRRAGAGYVVTGPDGAESTVADLVARGAFADAVDDRV